VHKRTRPPKRGSADATWRIEDVGRQLQADVLLVKMMARRAASITSAEPYIQCEASAEASCRVRGNWLRGLCHRFELQ
jgi:hypothetical protein